jgi:hypothetical protein
MKDRVGDSSGTGHQDNPFRVLGVALIVDQRGAGARLVARYPTQPSPGAGTSTSTTPSKSEEEFTDDDLFFTLTARQMAKLFRTKKSLCGQPMTLTVNGTVFCCRSVLVHGEDTGEETTSTSDSKNQLVLFSVIVAMNRDGLSASPFSSWLDTATEDQIDLQRYLKEATAAAASSNPKKAKKTANGRVSSTFLSIRRVHISLGRYCRVLEREEHRCHYVSMQADRFFRVRNERQKQWEEQKAAGGLLSPGGTQQGSNNQSSSGSVMSTKSTATPAELRKRHRRTHTAGTSLAEMEDHLSKVQQQETTVQEEQEKEQEILELMLAATPPEAPPGCPQHHGNLVGELVQVFHSLSRNDHGFPPTPTALLSERDGVVYVNQHIAIPVDAASLKPSQAADGPIVRPYYTLLFPHASPSALLQAFQSSGSSAPQRLQQLLLTVNPQKALTDIAVDANLPLFTTMEMASYLVTHGACVTSPVVSRQSRLTCLHIEKIPELALEFSQTFASVHLFRLVGFLTAAKTLGEAMSVLTNVETEDGAWLRECLAPSGTVRQDLSKVLTFSPEELSPKGTSGQPQAQERPHRWVKELEELLYAMTIWLLSHRVLTQMQEYLVVVDHEKEVAPSSMIPALDANENLFRELLESEFLNGDTSIMALSWRLGLDQQKVRNWGLRHRRIIVLSRIPAVGDDWESEPSS